MTARSSSRGWLSLAAVCLGMMMTFLNITATISALSSIQADLHTSTGLLVAILVALVTAVPAAVFAHQRPVATSPTAGGGND